MRFQTNASGRDFVVGDIHGHVGLFDELLKAAAFNPARDRVFSVGDLIDRGPDSRGALALLDEPWFYSVRGNHEEMLVGVMTQRIRLEMWIQNGGRWALDCTSEQLVDYAQRLMELPLVIVVGEGAHRFNVLHAETFLKDAQIDAGTIGEREEQRMLWARSIISGQAAGYSFDNAGLSKTYVGHTVRPHVQCIGQHVFIDTGSYLDGGRLTLIEPATGDTWSAKNQRQGAELEWT